jgi:hypothetical protein
VSRRDRPRDRLAGEFGELREKTGTVFQQFIIELAVLTGLILALTISLVLLRKADAPANARRD